MATSDNITTWIEETDPEAIKPGMKIKVIERYKDGPTVTYEGVVYGTERYYSFEGGGDVVSYKVATQVPDLDSVTVYREPKRLLMAAGSAIKVYDPSYLRDRVAIRRGGGDIVGRYQWHWFWADISTPYEEIVPDHLLENAEVLFDAGQA